MQTKFNTYYRDNQLFTSPDKILLTVSGGMDSVFMVHLFLSSKLNFAIAHCNFKLRGDDAEKDEEFVRLLAEENQIQFHNIAFNTNKYAIENGISIQMAARDLRYAWFEKVRKDNKYNYIATAHHKNDVAETMLINLSKGTGLAGLHGIKAKNDKLIRPLLCFTRKEIEVFVKENKIAFREDESNSDTKYVRNKIRHQVIPELEKINPSLIETLSQEAQQFSELEEIVSQKIDEVKEECVLFEDNQFKIDIDKLKLLTPLKTYLYYLIKDFGFNSDDVSDIIVGIDGQSGKIYYSDSYQLLKDRKELIISPKEDKRDAEYHIESATEFEKLPISIIAEIRPYTAIQINKSKEFAYLDIERVQFPLKMRKWEEGDFFQPLGMNGKKKVSNFFVDEKFSILEKEKTWLLLTDNKICWIVGHRISEEFKITSSTKKVLSLHLK